MCRRKSLFKIGIFLLCIIYLSIVSADIFQETGIIIVNIKDFRNNDGVARVTLFDQKKGFPNKYKYALAYGDSPVQDSSSQYIFRDVLYGQYSVGVFHDEDENGKLKSNLIGMPREGVGVSNNAKGSFGPPKFKDCLFSVDRDTVELSIDLNYL